MLVLAPNVILQGRDYLSSSPPGQDKESRFLKQRRGPLLLKNATAPGLGLDFWGEVL